MTTGNNAKLHQLKTAFLRAIDRAGNVHRLHLKTTVSEASLNRYRSGKQDIVNAPFMTLLQLFPELEIRYFVPKSRKTSPVLESELLARFRALSKEDQAVCLQLVAERFPIEDDLAPAK